MNPHSLALLCQRFKYADSIVTISSQDNALRSLSRTEVEIQTEGITARYSNLPQAVYKWLQVCKPKTLCHSQFTTGKKILESPNMQVFVGGKFFYIKVETAIFRVDCDFDTILNLFRII